MRAWLVGLLLLSSCVHTPIYPVNQNEIGATVRLVMKSEIEVASVPDGGPGRSVTVIESCSGVAVGKHDILTAAHCVRSSVPSALQGIVEVGALQITVFDYTGGELCRAVPVKQDDAKDLALLHTECALDRTVDVGVYQPSPGTPIQVTGYPQGSEAPVMADGYVTTTIDGPQPIGGKQVCSAPIVGGNSGGPVWWGGGVVGIVSMGSLSFHHSGLIVTLTSIRGFLYGK